MTKMVSESDLIERCVNTSEGTKLIWSFVVIKLLDVNYCML